MPTWLDKITDQAVTGTAQQKAAIYKDIVEAGGNALKSLGENPLFQTGAAVAGLIPPLAAPVAALRVGQGILEGAHPADIALRAVPGAGSFGRIGHQIAYSMPSLVAQTVAHPFAAGLTQKKHEARPAAQLQRKQEEQTAREFEEWQKSRHQQTNRNPTNQDWGQHADTLADYGGTTTSGQQKQAWSDVGLLRGLSPYVATAALAGNMLPLLHHSQGKNREEDETLPARTAGGALVGTIGALTGMGLGAGAGHLMGGGSGGQYPLALAAAITGGLGGSIYGRQMGEEASRPIRLGSPPGQPLYKTSADAPEHLSTMQAAKYIIPSIAAISGLYSAVEEAKREDHGGPLRTLLRPAGGTLGATVGGGLGGLLLARPLTAALAGGHGAASNLIGAAGTALGAGLGHWYGKRVGELLPETLLLDKGDDRYKALQDDYVEEKRSYAIPDSSATAGTPGPRAPSTASVKRRPGDSTAYNVSALARAVADDQDAQKGLTKLSFVGSLLQAAWNHPTITTAAATIPLALAARHQNKKKEKLEDEEAQKELDAMRTSRESRQQQLPPPVA